MNLDSANVVIGLIISILTFFGGAWLSAFNLGKKAKATDDILDEHTKIIERHDSAIKEINQRFNDTKDLIVKLEKTMEVGFAVISTEIKNLKEK